MKVFKENVRLAAELAIANKELAFESAEKAKRAAELAVANKELTFQNEEKAKRAAELAIANEKLVIANTEINHIALYDQLTELANRRLLFNRIKYAQTISKRNKQQNALLFLDLDKFKLVNDTLGHVFGDLLLQQVAEQLKTNVREGDTVARLGGDEFVVLIEGLGEDVVKAKTVVKNTVEKMLALLDKPYQLNDRSWKSAASVGIILFNGNELNPDELLGQADIAMYQAKSEGGNGMRFFVPVA